MRSPSIAQNKGDLGNWAPEQLENGPHGEIVLSITWPQINFIRGAQCAQKMELGTFTIPWQLGKFILWGRLYEMIKSSRTATKGTLRWNYYVSYMVTNTFQIQLANIVERSSKGLKRLKWELLTLFDNLAN